MQFQLFRHNNNYNIIIISKLYFIKYIVFIIDNIKYLKKYAKVT